MSKSNLISLTEADKLQRQARKEGNYLVIIYHPFNKLCEVVFTGNLHPDELLNNNPNFEIESFTKEKNEQKSNFNSRTEKSTKRSN
jgi:hypothetical protein